MPYCAVGPTNRLQPRIRPGMAKDNRDYKSGMPPRDKEPPGPEKLPDSDQSTYGDHPFLGNDRQPLKKELLRFPERSKVDPVTRLPADPARDASRHAFESQPHHPNIDYQDPNPMTVIPPPNITLKLAGSLAALLLFVVVMWFMFHNWMSPSPRHPGEQKQGQGLEQKIP